MGLPDPDYFTCVELAKRWEKKYGECTPELILRYITTGKLNAEEKITYRNLGNGISWVTGKQTMRKTVHCRWYEIPLAEVLRFEIECSPIPDVEPPMAESTAALAMMVGDEKPADYAERRKEEGTTRGQIARELRSLGVHLSTIGRTLEPEPRVGNSAYQKRGKKLVKQDD